MSDDPPATGPPGRTGPPPRQATFSDLFAIAEFRSLYLALTLSWLGDYLARAAITVLVYQRTGSALLSAASLSLSFLPWIVGGPLLTALAERYPYRQVMILCDLGRMGLVCLILLPGLPIAGMFVLLVLGALLNAPAQAARSALLPIILTRDRLVFGMAVNASTSQAAQVLGYLAGATLATAFSPRLVLAADAVSFGLSALLIARGVLARPAAVGPGKRRHLLRETAEGFSMVFGNRLLRQVAVLVFALMLFAIVPEGLAAAWVAETYPDGQRQGLSQGLIMSAIPVGFIVGGLVIGRLVPPARRPGLIRPLAVVAPLALVPVLAGPPPPVVALLAVVTGFAVAGLLPVLNGLFVLALPHGYRARAFGVMQGGMQITQGVAILLTGLLAEHFSVPSVVGAWSLGGAVLMLFVAARWPGADAFDAAIAAADEASPDATRVTPAPRDDVMSPPPAAGRMER